MSDDLERLLVQATSADGRHRIEFRDRIAAHGAEAVRRLEPWLADRRLAAFAVVTIVATADRGARREAIAALRRARPAADPWVHADIDRAIAKLSGPRGGQRRSAEAPGSGSVEDAERELRRLVGEWRRRGSPPQGAIHWRKADWIAAFPAHQERFRALPPGLDRTDVRRVAGRALKGSAEAEFAFLVTKAWGEGDNGYGPTRALESIEITQDPGQRLLAVAQTLHERGALAAYRRFGDGGDCRIFYLGPAFGTKFLYFSQPADQRPQALIHDKNVAKWLHMHAGFPRPSAAWSPRRYEAYLVQMHTRAEALRCAPEDLELCMFRSTLDPGNQWSGD